MTDIKAIAEKLVNLTVKECHELAQILKDEYGLEPPQSSPVFTGLFYAPQPAEVAEQTKFDVVLREVGPAKLSLMKMLKEMTGIGLIEAKVIVDEAVNSPVVIKSGVSKDEADALQKALKESGAEIDIK